MLATQKVLPGDEDGHTLTNYSLDLNSKKTFSLIISIDMERSFSLYMHILSNMRTDITPENMDQ